MFNVEVFSVVMGLCHGVWWCVTTGSGYKIIFGKGTLLHVESSKS